MKSDVLFDIESFDGFAILRSRTNRFAADEMQSSLTTMKQLGSDGVSLIFLDFGNIQDVAPEQLDLLTQEIRDLKAKHHLEVGLLYEPALGARLMASPVAQLTISFERQDETARRVATKRILTENRAELLSRLKATLDDAVDVALKRFLGQPALSKSKATLEVNPSSDVISVVLMNVDGFDFRVFLSVSLPTLRGMVKKFLKLEVNDEDEMIPDGACELLNYLTAYFKQHLTRENSVVETDAPQLFPVDEMTATVIRNLPSQRVQTEHGTFDVWLDEAA